MFAPLLLGSALELAARRDEGGLALSHGKRTITWGELDATASALAFALERRGVAPGDRVATLLGGAEAVVAFWAIAKASAVGVALDESDLEELAATLRALDARALVVDAEVAPTFQHAVARAPGLRAVIVRGRAPDVEATGSAAYVSYETALAEEDPLSRSPARRIDLDDAWLERDDEERVALSHRVLLARGASLAAALDLAPEDALSGTSMSELAVACALSGASLRIGEGAAFGAARTLFVGAADDEPESGATAIRLHRSTRCGPIAVLAESNEPARLLPNVDARIVDETGAPVAAKVVGEIAVRSSSVAGSVDYLRTGEAGMLDDAGALYVL